MSRTARLYKSGAKGAVPAPKNKQKKGDLSNKKPNKTKSEGDVYKKQPYQKNSKASMNTDKVI